MSASAKLTCYDSFPDDEPILGSIVNTRSETRWGCTGVVPEQRLRGNGWSADITAVDPGWVLQVGYADFRSVDVRLIAGEPMRKMKG